MSSAPFPKGEAQRLETLKSYEILDTLPEQAYDDLAQLAAEICKVPIALVSLIDTKRQWFKSRVGIVASETPRDLAFCAHAILEPDQTFIVKDASRDPRFSSNPLVTSNPDIRYYAGAPLISSNGQPLGTLCVIDRVSRDLTDSQLESLSALSRQVMTQLELRLHLRELEDYQMQLQNANRDLDDFAYVASHDLKEPLRGMSCYSQFLIEDYAEVLDDDGVKKLNTIVGLSQRTSDLIDSLLEYSRAGRSEERKKETDLDEVLDNVLYTLEVSLEEAGIEIRRTGGALPVTKCDGVAVGEVFRNLITNATKYNDKAEKWIEIGHEVVGRGTRFFVRDNGIGIEEKNLGKIFQIFQRLHDKADYGGGTGAGLCIVRKLVERHDGRIDVESTPGEGTTFWFTLEGASDPAMGADEFENESAPGETDVSNQVVESLPGV